LEENCFSSFKIGRNQDLQSLQQYTSVNSRLEHWRIRNQTHTTFFNMLCQLLYLSQDLGHTSCCAILKRKASMNNTKFETTYLDRLCLWISLGLPATEIQSRSEISVLRIGQERSASIFLGKGVCIIKGIKFIKIINWSSRIISEK